MKKINADVYYFAVRRDQKEAITSYFSEVHYRLIHLFGYKMKDINNYIEEITINKEKDNDLTLFLICTITQNFRISFRGK